MDTPVNLKKRRHRHMWNSAVNAMGELELACPCGREVTHPMAAISRTHYQRGIVATDGSRIVWYGPKEEVVDLNW